jgi:hypothetical protein
MRAKPRKRLVQAIEFLNLHYKSFAAAVPFAKTTLHPVPCDTRGWSQILVSILTGLGGRGREKGPDLLDGSDVKGANTWEAIDTPRFNGCIKAATKSATAGRIESLDNQPFLFFVLWDHAPTSKRPRCRVWSVRTQHDRIFRAMCQEWYDRCRSGRIVSTNFQLHPPRGRDSDEFRNECGNLLYPLLLCAEYSGDAGYEVIAYHPEVLQNGECRRAPQAAAKSAT